MSLEVDYKSYIGIESQEYLAANKDINHLLCILDDEIRQTEDILDVESILNLLNNFRNDPEYSYSTVLACYTVLGNVYSKLSRRHEHWKTRLEGRKDQLGKIYYANNEENPLTAANVKLTKAAVDAWINQDLQVTQFEDMVRRYGQLKFDLYHLKDVLSKELDFMRLMMENMDAIPASGTVIDRAAIRESVSTYHKLEEELDNVEL